MCIYHSGTYKLVRLKPYDYIGAEDFLTEDCGRVGLRERAKVRYFTCDRGDDTVMVLANSETLRSGSVNYSANDNKP